jgi:surfactin synthase thioesterase subunit
MEVYLECCLGCVGGCVAFRFDLARLRQEIQVANTLLIISAVASAKNEEKESFLVQPEQCFSSMML